MWSSTASRPTPNPKPDPKPETLIPQLKTSDPIKTVPGGRRRAGETLVVEEEARCRHMEEALGRAAYRDAAASIAAERLSLGDPAASRPVAKGAEGQTSDLEQSAHAAAAAAAAPWGAPAETEAARAEADAAYKQRDAARSEADAARSDAAAARESAGVLADEMAAAGAAAAEVEEELRRRVAQVEDMTHADMEKMRDQMYHLTQALPHSAVFQCTPKGDQRSLNRKTPANRRSDSPYNSTIWRFDRLSLKNWRPTFGVPWKIAKHASCPFPAQPAGFCLKPLLNLHTSELVKLSWKGNECKAVQ